MKKLLIIIALGSLSFVMTKNPDMSYFRSLFREVVLNNSDTLHFGPDEFVTGSSDSGLTTFLDIVLHNGNSGTGSAEFSNGNFYLPIMRTMMNGHEVFIAEYGDTNDIAIYAGKDVILYVYQEKKGFTRSLVLASSHAGEGPWYETDSWLTDLNRDGKTDILSHETGEYMEREDENGADAWNMVIVDNFTGYTLNDTGFVSIPVPNPDSLGLIYRNHHLVHDPH